MNPGETKSNDFDDLLSRLNAWAETRDLTGRAIEGLAECFRNEDGGTIDGWAYGDIQTEFFSQSLHFKHSWLEYPYIVTQLRLKAKSGEEIGYYDLVTLLSGEVEDDYLVFSMSREEFATR